MNPDEGHLQVRGVVFLCIYRERDKVIGNTVFWGHVRGLYRLHTFCPDKVKADCR